MKIDRPILIALLLLASLLFGFYLLAPKYRIFKELQADLGEKQAEYNAQFDYFSQIAKVYNDIESRKEDIAKVDDALPEDPNFGKLVFFFQKKAEENGLIIKDLFLSKSSAQKESDLKETVISLDLMGSYSSLGSFINSLEKSARILEVASISFGSGSLQASSVNLAQFQSQQTYLFRMEVKTYSY